MYTITKQFEFSASHRLDRLPEEHKCFALHGHNYTVTIELQSGYIDKMGFVIDYGQLQPFKDWLDQTFDHKHLNDVVEFHPTAENLAIYIYEKWHDNTLFSKIKLTAVTVQETPKTSATWRIAS